MRNREGVRVTRATSPGLPMVISKRLLAAMIRAGFVHQDGPYRGQPNKRRFAEALRQEAGRGDLQTWERRVYAWTSEEDPSGMSPENIELAARVLNIGQDELRPASVLASLDEENR